MIVGIAVIEPFYEHHEPSLAIIDQLVKQIINRLINRHQT